MSNQQYLKQFGREKKKGDIHRQNCHLQVFEYLNSPDSTDHVRNVTRLHHVSYNTSFYPNGKMCGIIVTVITTLELMNVFNSSVLSDLRSTSDCSKLR